MANQNLQAIAFTNQVIRPTADVFYSAYLTAKKTVQQWNSQGVATVIPNDATIISDGAAIDGRAQITNADATSIITRCQQLINWFENDVLSGGIQTLSTLGTVTKPAVNGKSVI